MGKSNGKISALNVREFPEFFEFRTKLKHLLSPSRCYVVEVPMRISQVIGIKGCIPVTALIENSVELITALCPYAIGRHHLRIDSWTRKQTGLEVGQLATVRFQVHHKPVTATLPQDLLRELHREDLLEAFRSLSAGKQNHEIRQIERCANPHQRNRKIQKAIEVIHQIRERKLDSRANANFL